MIILLGEEFPLVLYLLWCYVFLIIPTPFGAHQLLSVDQISSLAPYLPDTSSCPMHTSCLLPASKHKAQPKPHAAYPLISQKTWEWWLWLSRICWKEDQSLANPNRFPCIPACQQRDGCKCSACTAKEVNPVTLPCAGACVQLPCKPNAGSGNAELMWFMGFQPSAFGIRCKFSKWGGGKYIHTYMFVHIYVIFFLLPLLLISSQLKKKIKSPSFYWTLDEAETAYFPRLSWSITPHFGNFIYMHIIFNLTDSYCTFEQIQSDTHMHVNEVPRAALSVPRKRS